MILRILTPKIASQSSFLTAWRVLTFRRAIVALALLMLFTSALFAKGNSPYLCSRVQPSGPSLYWANRTITLRPSLPTYSDVTERDLVDAMKWAAEQWSNTSCSNVKIVIGSVTDQGWIGYDWSGLRENMNIVTVRKSTQGDFQSQWLHTNKQVALTSLTYIPGTGEILDADIELDAEHFTFTNCPDADSTCVTLFDMKNTLTHEFGHVLGLDHPPASEPGAETTTMFAESSCGEIHKRTLASGDIEGVCALYPTDEASKEHYGVSRVAPPVATIAAAGGCAQGAGASLPAFSFLLLLFFFAFNTNAVAEVRVNPFFAPSPLFLQAPDFANIKDSDFEPAFEEGMRQQLAEVEAIAQNPAKPTFENTIAALEKSGQVLNRARTVFSHLTGANTNETLQKMDEAMAPKFSAHRDTISFNISLFKRIKTLYSKRTTLKLDTEELRLLEYDYENGVLAGADLPEAQKKELKKMNEEIASLRTKFGNELLAADNAAALIVDSRAELAGLPDDKIDAAAKAAEARGLKGKWLLPLQNTTQQPLLRSLTNRSTREKLFKASWGRAERGDHNDTRAGILKLAMLRAKKAKLLGFKDYASLALQERMAKTPEAVERFLGGIAGPAAVRAKAEAADIQAVIDQQKGGFKLEPWDWDFYAEQVRKAKYNLDGSQVRPYFELNRVLSDGVFYAANLLYGITFKERRDLPVWTPDVRVFEVHNEDGSLLGLFYGDYFKRDNKQGGAWNSTFVTQSKVLGQKPVAYNVTNFAKPAPGQPAFISVDEVRTMFHEFGHALHSLFGDEKYPSLAGTNTERDWVEFPSQFNENWAKDPKVFAHYARHFKTGKAMPQALVDKINKAGKFNLGYATTEAIGASELDMQWHMLEPKDVPTDVDTFERTALARTHLNLAEVPPRYRTSYFSHIWASGYASGYYAYTWTRMLGDDIFGWFKENGGLTRKNGQRLRDMILSRGATIDYGKMFRDFRGRDPSIEPYLETQGLKTVY